MQPLRSIVTSHAFPAIAIRTAGELGIVTGGTPVRIEGRGPRKPLELLSLLIAAGRRGAAMGKAADLLWPEADGFDAYRCLVTTVHRLRRLLGHYRAVNVSAGRIRLDETVCEVDAWGVEQVLGTASDRARVQSALAVYDRPFLEDDMTPWVIAMRERLEKLIGRSLHIHGLPPRSSDCGFMPARAGEIGIAG